MRPFVETHHAGDLRLHAQVPTSFPAHLHLQMEMVYLFSGSAQMQVDGQIISLSPGSLCLCFPGVIHSYLASCTDRSLMLILPPDSFPDFSRQLLRFHPENPCLPFHQLPPDVSLCMEQIHQEIQRQSPDSKVVQGYLQVVLSRVLPLFNLLESPQEPRDIIYRMLQYLSEHFLSPITLHDLAHAMGVGESYLSHLFSQHLQTNFRSYINALRIDYACQLLRTTDYSITRIAYESGFETQRTFNRAFLEHSGAAPREYRLSHFKSEESQTKKPTGE